MLKLRTGDINITTNKKENEQPQQPAITINYSMKLKTLRTDKNHYVIYISFIPLLTNSCNKLSILIITNHICDYYCGMS